MADTYPHDVLLVLDIDGKPVPGAVGNFYATDDTGYLTPLPWYHEDGTQGTGDLTADRYGLIGASERVRLTVLKAMFKSGNLPAIPSASVDGLVDEVTKTAALVGAPAGDAIAANLGNPASQSRAILDGAYAPPPDNGNRPIGKGELFLNVKDFGAKGDGSTNDTAAINAALAAMEPGDTLYFPRGRYITSGGHVIDKPSVKIIGAGGRAQTYNSSAQLYLRNGANADMLTIAANQVTVRDLSLYGNYNNQTATSRGLVTPNTIGANYLLLDAVWVDSFNGDGFSFEGTATLSSTVVNCESRKNRGYGMRFYGTATDSMIANCYIDQNTQSGVYCSAGDLSLTSVHIWGNGTGASGDRDGITFQSSNGCRVINCYIETQYEGAGIRFKSGINRGHIVQGCDIWANGFQGIYGYAASNVAINGNVIRANNYKGSSGSGGAGITLDSCSGISTTGNNMFSVAANRQTYGYYEVGTSNAGNTFLGNVSRAAEHTTGNWLIAEGGTLPANPELFNAG